MEFCMALAYVVNTGIFILGCLIFFVDTVKDWAIANGKGMFAYIMIAFVGLNFIFELITNVVLSPSVVKLIDIRKGKSKPTDISNND